MTVAITMVDESKPLTEAALAIDRRLWGLRGDSRGRWNREQSIDAH
jgi:type II secretory pathway predicted ATPase ExeA